LAHNLNLLGIFGFSFPSTATLEQGQSGSTRGQGCGAFGGVGKKAREKVHGQKKAKWGCMVNLVFYSKWIRKKIPRTKCEVAVFLR
jgi:hypothetical protein